VGGAHESPDEAARLLGAAVGDALDGLVGLHPQELRKARRAKFRSMGILA
jgi:acetyl-CoA carboxylase alpha subunit